MNTINRGYPLQGAQAEDQVGSDLNALRSAVTAIDADMQLALDNAADAVGWGKPVFNWQHSLNVSSVVMPIVDGVYELQMRFMDGGRIKNFHTSEDGGETITTWAKSKGIDVAVHSTGINQLVSNIVGGNYASLLAGATMDDVHTTGRLYVRDSGKRLSLHTRSFSLSSNVNAVWTDDLFVATVNPQNAIKFALGSGSYLPGSSIKAWKVA